MKLKDIKQGLEVKTVFNLESTQGFFVNPKHILARKPNAEGTVRGFVPHYSGDVWWVEHKDGSVAAYSFTEFNPL